jgi:hypothetical protein
MVPVPETNAGLVPPVPGLGADGSLLPPPPAPGGMIPLASGPIPLRPMGVGEILDVAIRVYKANWKVLMSVVGLVVLPFTLFQAVVMHSVAQQELIGGRTYFATQADFNTFRTATYIFFALNLLVIGPFLRGAMARAVGGIYLGERPTAGASLRYALGKLWPLLVALVLSSLIIGIGFVLLVVPGVIFYVRYAFVTQVIVVEGGSGSASLTRSWRLSKGNGLRIFGALFVAAIITAILSAVILVPFLLIFLNNGGGAAGWVIRAVLTSAVSIVTTPFAITVAVLLYFDSRIRNEAFDLTVMSREVGQNPS